MSALSCPLCRAPFDSEVLLPFQLPCGHNLCSRCIPVNDTPVQCPCDGRLATRTECRVSVFSGALGGNWRSTVKTQVEGIKAESDERLTQLHTTFNSMQSQLEARKFVLRAEASGMAAERIQHLQNLINSAWRLKQQEIDDGIRPVGVKQLSEKVASVHKEHFRLNYIFDKANANRFISTIGIEQPDLIRTDPYECGSFTNVTYWMVPPCCSRHYCCVKCHNQKEDHVWQYANRMICIYCGREQEYRKLPNKCIYCQHDHTGVVAKH